MRSAGLLAETALRRSRGRTTRARCEGPPYSRPRRMMAAPAGRRISRVCDWKSLFDSPLEGDGFEPLVPRHEILGIPAGLRRRQSEPHPPLGSAQAGRERPVRRRRRRARDDAGVLCASDVLLRDPPGRQKLDQVAVIRGRDKSLPPGATRYARHFDHTPICKKSFDMSSFARVNCRFIIG